MKIFSKQNLNFSKTNTSADMQNMFTVKKYSDKRRGFSLVEMIVAMGIFAIVAVVALGALAKIISANRKAQSLQASVTNLNYALDAMTREMRFGLQYRCDNDVSIPSSFDPKACEENKNVNSFIGDVITFKSSKINTLSTPNCELMFAYRFRKEGNGFVLEKAEQIPNTSGCDAQFDDVNIIFYPIVDENVVITSYYIKVTEDDYPIATIRITGYAGIREREKSYFDVQTAVSPRILN